MNAEQWIPQKRGFKYVCPICNDEFIGRKGQIYCGKVCRARRNNDLAAKRKIEQGKLVDPYLLNVEILKNEMIGRENEVNAVPRIKLEALGFDEKAMNKRVNSEGMLWFRFGDWLIQLSSNNTEAEIKHINLK